MQDALIFRRNAAAGRLAKQADQHSGNEDGKQRHEDRHGVLREFALGSSKKNHGETVLASAGGLFDVGQGAGHNGAMSY